MAGVIIRPEDLTPRATPVASELMVVDNGVNVGAATVKAIVEAGRPAASQAEAHAGTEPTKAMTPLTTKQAIIFQGDVRFASAAQGGKADTAVQSLGAGENVSIDNTDPQNPVISSSGAVADATITRLKLTEALRAGISLTPYDFGAYGNATNDDTAAVSDLITAAQEVIATDSSTLAQLRHAVDLGIGRFKVTAPLPKLEYGLEMHGRGQSLTKIIGHGAFDLIETKEYQTDGITPNFMGGMVMRDFAIHNGDAANPSTGMKLRSLIRNSYVEKVAFKGLKVGFDVDRSWTLKFRDCWGLGVSGQTNHHILLGFDCGAITIDGGRYDLANDHILYVDAAGSDTVELLITNDAAFQFGNKSGIHMVGGRTVIIESAFLEGNCIGSPSEYHMYLEGSGTTLSHAVIKEAVLNNLADTNRDGAGVLFTDKFETVEFHERWNRNTVDIVPKIGTGVTRAILNLQSASTVGTANLTMFGSNVNASAEISQPARPKKFFGRDMTTGSLGENGAADFGRPGEGSVVLGSRNARATVQSHVGSAAAPLEINPGGGEVVFPPVIYRTTVTASNWTPLRHAGSAIVDTSGGARFVSLNSLAWVPEAGQQFRVWKPTSANSLSFVPPVGTDTINGVAGNKAVTASGLYIIEKQSSTQWLLTHQPLA